MYILNSSFFKATDLRSADLSSTNPSTRDLCHELKTALVSKSVLGGCSNAARHQSNCHCDKKKDDEEERGLESRQASLDLDSSPVAESNKRDPAR